MASRAARQLRTRALEIDCGLSKEGSFLAPAVARLAGSLQAMQVPSDFQRHEVGPSGEVLHLASLGFEAANLAQSGTNNSASASSSASRRTRNDSGRSMTQSEPWMATLYARGKSIEAARPMLADALRLPASALRTESSTLRMPGVSVQVVSLPWGLPPSFVREPPDFLRSGMLTLGGDPVIALGPAPQLLRASPAASARRPWESRKSEQGRWQCAGHRYTIVVRGLHRQDHDTGKVDSAVERLCEDGFLNSFDLAAFGHCEIRSYEIGAALWQGRWDMAARLLLATEWGDGGSPGAAARAAFRRGDFARGLDLLPDGCEGHRTLSLELVRGRPAVEALSRTVPMDLWNRSLRSISKFVWNRAACARLQEQPFRPVVGDLVWDEEAGKARPLALKELEGRNINEVLLPVPRLEEPVPECLQRLRMEADLRRLVPGGRAADYPASAPWSSQAQSGAAGGDRRPQARGQRSPLALRPLLARPTDASWDVVDAPPGALVDCDLARLGFGASSPSDADDDAAARRSRGRRSASRGASSLAGLALRARFTLPRGSSGEAALRELLRRNPSDFVAFGEEA
eukprot:TRINITY_DN8786_c0_g1_i1.p1 TRINITY_DN8786_c0_g1~~TRINITY_DN8786_c0_g1_i1.p1  ORF type:complete len:574 (+),score=79.23 TRINITY_DN8786_c0_g1_i1:105-1826(+)